MMLDDKYFMNLAIKQAELASSDDEVPIGCVVVWKNKIIAKSYNRTEALNDVTAHAEMQAITMATDTIGGKYLDQCTIYVTIEPCVMCAGALMWSKIGKIVYGAGDNRYGFSRFNPLPVHPKTEIVNGVMYEECSRIIKDFFSKKR